MIPIKIDNFGSFKLAKFDTSYFEAPKSGYTKLSFSLLRAQK